MIQIIYAWTCLQALHNSLADKSFVEAAIQLERLEMQDIAAQMKVF